MLKLDRTSKRARLDDRMPGGLAHNLCILLVVVAVEIPSLPATGAVLVEPESIQRAHPAIFVQTVHRFASGSPKLDHPAHLIEGHFDTTIAHRSFLNHDRLNGVQARCINQRAARRGNRIDRK